MKITSNFSSDQFNLRSLMINRRYLVFTASLVLVGIVVVFVALIPTVRQIFTLRSSIAVEDKRLEKLRIKADDLKNIEAQDVYSQRDQVNAVLPSHKPLLELLAGLNIIANQHNVQFTDLQLSPGLISTDSAELTKKTKSPTSYEEIPIQLTVSGTFGGVKNFLTDVERIAPLSNLIDISLNTQSQSGALITEEDVVTADLLVNTYYFTNSIAVTLEQPLPTIGAEEQTILSEILGYTYPSVSDQQEIISGGLEDLFQLSTQDAEQVSSELESAQ